MVPRCTLRRVVRSISQCPGRDSNPQGREGRGILSPLRLPIPPPGRAPQYRPAARATQRTLQSRTAAAGPPATSTAPPPPDVLDATTQMLLQREIARPLHGCHECGKLPLLLRSEVETPALKRKDLYDCNRLTGIVGVPTPTLVWVARWIVPSAL